VQKRLYKRPRYMRRKTFQKVTTITELGKTMTQRQIAEVLGCHRMTVSSFINRWDLPYQQKKRSGEPKFGLTAQRLLGMIGSERLKQSDVARELGVSRQRIEQLRDKLGLCQFLTKRGQDKVDAGA